MKNLTDFVFGQLCLSFACGFLIFLLVMGAEFLHWATDGEIPRLIDWHSPPKKRIMLDHAEDRETDESDADATEDGGLIQYWNP